MYGLSFYSHLILPFTSNRTRHIRSPRLSTLVERKLRRGALLDRIIRFLVGRHRQSRAKPSLDLAIPSRARNESESRKLRSTKIRIGASDRSIIFAFSKRSPSLSQVSVNLSLLFRNCPSLRRCAVPSRRRSASRAFSSSSFHAGGTIIAASCARPGGEGATEERNASAVNM